MVPPKKAAKESEEGLRGQRVWLNPLHIVQVCILFAYINRAFSECTHLVKQYMWFLLEGFCILKCKESTMTTLMKFLVSVLHAWGRLI